MEQMCNDCYGIFIPFNNEKICGECAVGQIEDLKEQVENLEEANNTLQGEVEDLKSDIEDYKQEIDNLNDNLSAYEKSNTHVNGKRISGTKIFKCPLCLEEHEEAKTYICQCGVRVDCEL